MGWAVPAKRPGHGQNCINSRQNFETGGRAQLGPRPVGDAPDFATQNRWSTKGVDRRLISLNLRCSPKQECA